MIEPKKGEPVTGRIGRVLLSALKRAVGYHDLDAEVDKTPSSDPIREIQMLSTRLESIDNAWDQYPITARMEIVSRQLVRK